jgi:hypothetical protein
MSSSSHRVIVYILRCADNSLCIGETGDLQHYGSRVPHRIVHDENMPPLMPISRAMGTTSMANVFPS